MNGTPLGFRVNTGALSKDGFSLRTVVDLPGQGIELASTGGRRAGGRGRCAL
jgi:hypothetical protein